MTTRTSLRIQRKEPEFGLLEKNTTNTRNIALQQPSSIFSRTRSNRTPASDPLPTREKQKVMPREVVTEADEVIQLSKDDMLRILSREMPLDRASIMERFMTKSNIKNQRVPSIYSSYFFRKDIIKEFQYNLMAKIGDEKRPSFPLSTYNLYNKDDILNNTFYRPDRIGIRYTEKNTSYSQESKANMRLFINLLSKKICSDIGGDYAKTAVQKAIDLVKYEDKFDILVASTRVIENLTLPITERLKGIVAFVIVELGECKKYPASYSINLICTDLKNAIPGTGSILMGAFLYTIVSHPNNTNPLEEIVFPSGQSFLNVTSKITSGNTIEKAAFTTKEPLIPVQQIAVLELASAYMNPGGLCMYEKFGFTYDQTMFSNESSTPPIDCFVDRNNLPMLIDFETKPGYSELNKEGKKNKILDIIAGTDRGFPKSKICSIRGNNQNLLGYLKSIKLYLDNEPGGSIDDFDESEIHKNILNELSLIISSSKTGRKRVSKNQLMLMKLDEIIDYIENPPSTPNTNMDQQIQKLITFIPQQTTGGMTRKKLRHNKRYTRKIR